MNTTVGTVESINAFYTLGPLSDRFTTIFQRANTGDYFPNSRDNMGDLLLFLPQTSLIGYTGGLCSVEAPCGTYDDSSEFAPLGVASLDRLVSGSAMAVAPTVVSTAILLTVTGA